MGPLSQSPSGTLQKVEELSIEGIQGISMGSFIVHGTTAKDRSKVQIMSYPVKSRSAQGPIKPYFKAKEGE